jgi:hypothetical protein
MTSGGKSARGADAKALPLIDKKPAATSATIVR